MEQSNSKQRTAPQSPASESLAAWKRPQLVRLGNVASLTATTKTAGNPDGGKGSMVRT